MRFLYRFLILLLCWQLAVPTVGFAGPKIPTHPKKLSPREQTLQRLIPIVTYKGKKYAFASTPGRNGRLKSRIIAGPNFSQTIYDEDENGYADTLRITRGKTSINATQPFKGYYTKVEIIEPAGKKIRYRRYELDWKKKTFRLTRNELRNPFVAANSIELCFDQSPSVVALRASIDDILKKSGDSDPVRALACRIEQLQGSFFDPSCLTDEWKDSAKETSKGLAELLVSASSDSSRMLKCLDNHGMGEEATTIASDLNRRFAAAVDNFESLGVNVSAAELAQLDKDPECKPIATSALSKRSRDQLVRCGPHPNKRVFGGYENSSHAVYDSSLRQISMFTKASSLATALSCPAHQASGSVLLHEMLHMATERADERLPTLGSDCCGGAVTGDKQAKACRELKDFTFARDVIQRYEITMRNYFPGYWEVFDSISARTGSEDIKNEYFRALAERYPQDWVIMQACTESCPDREIARLVEHTEKYFKEQCGPQGGLSTVGNTVVRAFSRKSLSRAECDSYKDQIVTMLTAPKDEKTDAEWLATLFPKGIRTDQIVDYAVSPEKERAEVKSVGRTVKQDVASTTIGSTFPSGPVVEASRPVTASVVQARPQPVTNIALLDREMPEFNPETAETAEAAPSMGLMRTAPGSGLGEAGSVPPQKSVGSPLAGQGTVIPASPAGPTTGTKETRSQAVTTVAKNTVSGLPGREADLGLPGRDVAPPAPISRADFAEESPTSMPSNPTPMGTVAEGRGSDYGYMRYADKDISAADDYTSRVEKAVRPSNDLTRGPSSALMDVLKPSQAGAVVAQPDTDLRSVNASRLAVGDTKAKGVAVSTAGSRPGSRSIARLSAPVEKDESSMRSSRSPSAFASGGGGGSSGDSSSVTAKKSSAPIAPTKPVASAASEGEGSEEEQSEKSKASLAVANVSGTSAASVRAKGSSTTTVFNNNFRNVRDGSDLAQRLTRYWSVIGEDVSINPRSRSELAALIPYGSSIRLANGNVVTSSRRAPTRAPGSAHAMSKTVIVQCLMSRQTFQVGVCK